MGIDNITRELLFPVKETVDWILHKHEYKIYKPIVFVKADEPYISPFNEVKELEIIPAKEEEPVIKKEEPVVQSYSKTFWSYLGWS